MRYSPGFAARGSRFAAWAVRLWTPVPRLCKKARERPKPQGKEYAEIAGDRSISSFRAVGSSVRSRLPLSANEHAEDQYANRGDAGSMFKEALTKSMF